jgi:pimeloyl-ACP methyl ester carboxylesterase
MKTLIRSDGETIAYNHIPGKQPGILFCTGFHSDMQGDKALALEALCFERGQQITRFDYFGHGRSSGSIEEGTIGRWRDDTLAILDQVTEGPQLLVGSSMGGWMMLLAALARPEKVVALAGIAIAADMTADIEHRRLTDAQRRSLDSHGFCDLPNEYDDKQPYRIRKQMLLDAEQYLLLKGDIVIDVPVRLLHGLADEDVPWQRSMEVVTRLQSSDVELQLIKAGDHRLSRPNDLERLCSTVGTLLQQLASNK